ncbi:MAG TPA: AMP-binding protein [Blastocatellia bacterium]|nr:AMP-binding protein [Blastocatellia bacterium]
MTVWETVPSLLEAMLGEVGDRQAGVASLRWVLVTGEACAVGLWRRFQAAAPGVGMMNAYGPTECSDDVTHYVSLGGRVAEEGRGVPIGRPLPNTRAYVVDAAGEAVPVGVSGELVIGGVGVGRGYWRRAGQTAARFVADEQSGERGERLYRTGDVARWSRDGELEYLGRLDDQVKVRGYRVELGEIEARLAECEGVGEAAVVLREETTGDKRLVAYFTQANHPEVAAEALRQQLSARLPEYMLPAAYVRLAQMPLTPNGKLDRKALPAPEGDSYATGEYEEPQGEIEQRLAAIWSEVLKVERVGRHDNFFELGGNSLLVVRVIARLRRAGLQADPHTLFTMPVLAELAAAINQPISVVEVPPSLIPEASKPEESPNTVEIRI